MTTRYTNRVLFLIVIVLLVTNFVLLFFFVFTPEKTKKARRTITPEAGMTTVLKDSVGFSDQQVAAYMDLRSIERPKLQQYFSSMRKLKRQYYDLNYNDTAQLPQLLDSIGIMQKRIDQHLRNYFMAIREISTPEQLPAFDNAIGKITTRMIGRQRGNRADSTSKSK